MYSINKDILERYKIILDPCDDIKSQISKLNTVLPNSGHLKIHALLYQYRNDKLLFDIIKECANNMKYIPYITTWWFISFLSFEQIKELCSLIGPINYKNKQYIMRLLLDYKFFNLIKILQEDCNFPALNLVSLKDIEKISKLIKINRLFLKKNN